MNNLGFKLRQKRKELGLLLKTVAEEVNMSASNLSFIERGIKSNPSIKVLKNLSDFYNVPIEYFIGEDTTENSTMKKNCSNTNFEISESLSPELHSKSNQFLTTDLSQLIETYYKRISACVNDNTRKIESFFIPGILEDTKTRFCILFDCKFIILKSNLLDEKLNQSISCFFENPFASFELLEGVLDKCEKIYLFCWLTPFGSEADAVKKISDIKNSYFILKDIIHDFKIKRMILKS